MGVRALVVGGGNMAQAIVRGALDAGVTTPSDWAVAEPDDQRRALFEGWGVTTGEDARAMLDASGPGCELWWAVKPQIFEKIAHTFGAVGERVVASIMAGVETASIRRHLGDGCRVVRVMPNTPVRVRMGVSALALGPGATNTDAAFVRSVFEGVGVVVDLEESLIDAFTGLAGSGPGYLFLVAEAMVRGGVEVGIPERDALAMVRALFRGSGELLATASETPAALREAVTSPGGTTAAGLEALNDARVPEAFREAILKARDRGRSLGGA